MLAADEHETIRRKIDWSALMLSFIRDCRDEDSLRLGIQKVVEELNEVLLSTLPGLRKKLKK
jgi:hypothetical protein